MTRESAQTASSIPTVTGRIWFHLLPDAKVVKNRLHLDLPVSGGRSVVDRNVPPATAASEFDTTDAPADGRWQ